MHTAALAVLLSLFAVVSRAAAPAWVNDACADLDCGAAYVGVGQADLLPEMRLSSAVAYAQAVRSLSSTMSDRITVEDRLYEEGRANSADSAVKAVVRSPLGSAMTKTYGGDASDVVSMAIELKRLDEPAPLVYAQEYVDVSSRTLYVRLFMSRSAAPVPALSDVILWKGGRIRVSSQDVRVGRKNEVTLWVEDQDAGLRWIEQWPTGGGSLLRDGKVESSYKFDRLRNVWREDAAPTAAAGGFPTAADPAAADR